MFTLELSTQVYNVNTAPQIFRKRRLPAHIMADSPLTMAAETAKDRFMLMADPLPLPDSSLLFGESMISSSASTSANALSSSFSQSLEDFIHCHAQEELDNDDDDMDLLSLFFSFIIHFFFNIFISVNQPHSLF